MERLTFDEASVIEHYRVCGAIPVYEWESVCGGMPLPEWPLRPEVGVFYEYP